MYMHDAPGLCLISHSPQANKPESSESSIEMVNFLLSSPAPQTQLISLDKLSSKFVAPEDDGFYFLRLHDDPLTPLLPSRPPLPPPAAAAGEGLAAPEDEGPGKKVEIGAAGGGEAKNRRKRPRAMKTSEEVESQRMTHIAVERNRRRQMNDHLRVLRSLMPGSYVQRGDQASIIGGAIEFVRELEQLLQCLESQKRRRLLGTAGEAPRAIAEVASHSLPFPGGCGADQAKLLDLDTGLIEEVAENKSCLADIEVRVVGFDAMIKILSHRRPAQLIDTIAALEDLQFAILHANVTTIEQTVLYSFNVKIAAESRWTAEDIANSVQQILSFIDASTV